MSPSTVAASNRALDLKELSLGLPGITPAFGAVLCEAGSVCLEEFRHRQGVVLNVIDFEEAFLLRWPNATPQARSCWNDMQVTVEHGAYGLAFLLILNLTPLTVIERSRKGPGFDYWLGDTNLFQKKARLEVSGILRGNQKSITARVNAKRKQVEKSKGSLPAYIAVVEFCTPVARLVTDE